jgi:hypothetical protein
MLNVGKHFHTCQAFKSEMVATHTNGTLQSIVISLTSLGHALQYILFSVIFNKYFFQSLCE